MGEVHRAYDTVHERHLRTRILTNFRVGLNAWLITATRPRTRR